jgi:protein TonB
LAGLGEDALDPRLRVFADSFVVGDGPPARASREPLLPRPVTMQADPLLVKPDPRDEAGGRPPAIARPEPSLPKPETREPPRVNTGAGDAPAGLDAPLRHTEVARKAMIVFKPEPGFTEDARRFNVTGVVRLRAILASDGQVKSLSVVKPLPHGLTRKALVAARSIRFQPAQKDGRAVSQYVVLEYNFNIY